MGVKTGPLKPGMRGGDELLGPGRPESLVDVNIGLNPGMVGTIIPFGPGRLYLSVK